jgi:hypothetical protein
MGGVFGFDVQRSAEAPIQKRQTCAKKAQAGAHGQAKGVWSVRRDEVVISPVAVE